MSTVPPPQTPPMPPKDLVGGHLFTWLRDPLSFYVDAMRRYGGLVHFKITKHDAYLITEPDLIQQVLTKDNAIWQKSKVYKDILSYYLGDGLLSSDGEFWRKQRKLMQPAFHHTRVNAYGETMVRYTQQMLAGWRDGETRDIAHDMMRLTLYIVGKTLFDVDLANRTQDNIERAVENLLRDIVTESVQFIRPPAWLPTPLKARKKQTVELLDDVVLDIIAARRQHEEDAGDLLSMMMQARDENGQGMSDRQLRDEALTIVLAGHETTANALTWTLYEISQQPHIAQRLHAEVDAVLQGRPPTLADLAHLTYHEMVIKEGLRKWPPAWSVARSNNEPTTLGGYAIPRYKVGIISPYATHRDERWYPDPERFDPQRFTPENEAQLTRYNYLPFGGGPRICIGNAFAMMEAQLILACIMQHYELHLAPGHVVEPQPLVTLRPKHGMKMQLRQRVLQPAQASGD